MSYFKGHEDPDEIIRFISENIDYDKMFTQLLKKKLELFYDCLSWDEATDKLKLLKDFFEFRKIETYILIQTRNNRL